MTGNHLKPGWETMVQTTVYWHGEDVKGAWLTARHAHLGKGNEACRSFPGASSIAILVGRYGLGVDEDIALIHAPSCTRVGDRANVEQHEVVC